MPAPTAKDEWIVAFARYIDERTNRGNGRYANMLAEQAWRERGDMTGEQAAMRWVAEHERSANAVRRTPRKNA